MVGPGTLMRWKKDSVRDVLKRVRWAAVISIAGAVVLPFLMGSFKPGAALGIGLALWVVTTSLQGVYERVKNRKNKLFSLFKIPAGFWGMTLGHIGIAVFAVGVSLTSLYSVEKDLRMYNDETVSIAGYDFTFGGVTQVNGPNYAAEEGLLTVQKDGKEVTILRAQKRDYDSQMGIMTEAAIDPGLTRDLFFALGEPLGSDSWSMRIYHKPFVRWIWLGAIFMGFGGIVAVMDKRYRRERSKIKVTSTTDAQVPG